MLNLRKAARSEVVEVPTHIAKAQQRCFGARIELSGIYSELVLINQWLLRQTIRK